MQSRINKRSQKLGGEIIEERFTSGNFFYACGLM
jgi:hypothetical protein